MTKVLVADDNDDIRESTSDLLRVLGYDVVAVGESSTIIDTVRREHPDVLLQDARMPGLDLVRHIRSIKADPELSKVALILFSGAADACEEGVANGADGAVTKPFSPSDLKQVVDSFVAGATH